MPLHRTSLNVKKPREEIVKFIVSISPPRRPIPKDAASETIHTEENKQTTHKNCAITGKDRVSLSTDDNCQLALGDCNEQHAKTKEKDQTGKKPN
jgi:hypothetical protein